MKIAISSNDGKYDTPLNPRFGRCEFFVIVDTDSRAWEAQANPAAMASGGAGTHAVQFLSQQGVQAVITGRCGPNAFSAFNAAHMDAFQADSGTPEELVDKFLAGELKQISSASGKGHV